MWEYAGRTCIEGQDCTPKRYLWTDAFALFNLLNLFDKRGEEKYIKQALQLIEQVHHILGKHREDDSRNGWISGLSGEKGEQHPTIGGLRIGKQRNERRMDEPYDERAEWEQDGQYYHYLTKWMHALNLASETTNDPKYRQWALELARTAYEKFTYDTPTGTKRMYWKMSIDLTYPLVPSMGQHDALDGYITYMELKGNGSGEKDLPEALLLNTPIESLWQMAQAVSWESDDPLGIGGLLSDACILAQMIVKYKKLELSDVLYGILVHSLQGIKAFMQTETLKYPAKYRLAFRELGLSIGLHGISKMKGLLDQHAGRFTEPVRMGEVLDELEAYAPLCDYIEKFWLESENRKSPAWIEHLDINSVMLATSLDPDGYLRI